MKKPTLKPGFEFIFSLALICILGLPPVLFAQSKKDLDINITNGDTTVNGKNIKDLSAKDRRDALQNIGSINSIAGPDSSWHKMHLKRMHKDINGMGDKMQFDMQTDDNHPMAMGPDGRRPDRNFRMRKHMDNDSTFAFNYRMNGERPPMPPERGMRPFGDRPGRGFESRNTQNFNYVNVDDKGISTHASYHVSEPSGAVAHIPGEAEPTQYEMLDIKDLVLVPQFSEGKTMISFSLPAKLAADVKLKDGQGNVLWADKALNGHFSKSFAMGLNGEYLLQVKQGKKITVKRIVKD